MITAYEIQEVREWLYGIEPYQVETLYGDGYMIHYVDLTYIVNGEQVLGVYDRTNGIGRYWAEDHVHYDNLINLALNRMEANIIGMEERYEHRLHY